jgi:hypothetical protein
VIGADGGAAGGLGGAVVVGALIRLQFRGLQDVVSGGRAARCLVLPGFLAAQVASPHRADRALSAMAANAKVCATIRAAAFVGRILL